MLTIHIELLEINKKNPNNAIENMNSEKTQMAYKHVKSCSTSTVTGGMQNKLHHFIYIKLTKV